MLWDTKSYTLLVCLFGTTIVRNCLSFGTKNLIFLPFLFQKRKWMPIWDNLSCFHNSKVSTKVSCFCSIIDISQVRNLYFGGNSNISQTVRRFLILITKKCRIMRLVAFCKRLKDIHNKRRKTWTFM